MVAHRRIPAQSGLIVAAAGAATYSCRLTQQSYAGIGRPPCFTVRPRVPPKIMTLDRVCRGSATLAGRPFARTYPTHALDTRSVTGGRFDHEYWRIRVNRGHYERPSHPARLALDLCLHRYATWQSATRARKPANTRAGRGTAGVVD